MSKVDVLRAAAGILQHGNATSVRHKSTVSAQTKGMKRPFYEPDIPSEKGTAVRRECCRRSRKGEEEEGTVQHRRRWSERFGIVWRLLCLSSRLGVSKFNTVRRRVGGIIRQQTDVDAYDK
jgi:hypothetical protein